MDCSLPGSSVHGISQTRVLERVAISLCRGSSRCRDQTASPALAGRFFTTSATCGEGNGNSLQYSYLENPMDRGAWWTAVHGVAQSWTQLMWLRIHARIEEGNGNPLQCSCLENPRDGGAWWAAYYGVAQSLTRLKWFSSSSSSIATWEAKMDGSKCITGEWC